jgi:hypothetical protein
VDDRIKRLIEIIERLVRESEYQVPHEQVAFEEVKKLVAELKQGDERDKRKAS